MKKTIIIAILLLASNLAGAQKVELKGEISSVIVYRGQALVTRTINVDLPEGTSELVVNDLPSKILPESLYSQSPDGTTVLSLRYREKAIKEDTREEVKKLDEEIDAIKKKLRHNKHAETLLDARAKRFASLWNFSVDSTKMDIDKSLIQADQIKDLTGHVDLNIVKLHNERVELEDQKLDLTKDLELLNRKRNKLASDHSRTLRQAVLHLTKSDNKPAIIELSYLVNGANWTPQYNFRANPAKAASLIEYNAIVHQSSGESWDNTSIALSTAQPSLIAGSPTLSPMQIGLSQAFTPQILNNSNKSGPVRQQAEQQVRYVDQTKQFDSILSSRRRNITQGLKGNSALNSLALDNQIMELNADKMMQQKMQARVAVIKRTEGVSVMYRLPGKITMPSRSDQQMITIASINAKADFTLVATPLLTDYVYLQAQITNDSNTILLPGAASMYRNGEFVGKSDMKLVTIGQTFTAGFGIDSQIQVSREFTDKKVETLWGNRVDEQEYSVSISNFKKTPVKLRLLERLPYTKNPNIEILVKEMSHKLSTDSEYVRTDKEKGILRWDLDLKPNTTNAEAMVIKYSYTMKYDNDMRIKPIN